ncbi:hypothetical protein BJ684DRAFT_17169 [Piptocephalis cylindrospora]|uniref:ubiquitinyl hydrolase 1 n=1 Tax=Piptocephalis cylindrospora TaxID=1907219 RepID=A0A4P9Y2P2_9FUNG|nr:hypothetical protein BJ684DRAFT_17169 [Piptocephalis cylindrospora]|eukprot:RKP12331.1 hypothetical protein BJ684DRAFT_17169 [Piptocephalis cylindrospora]
MPLPSVLIPVSREQDKTRQRSLETATDRAMPSTTDTPMPSARKYNYPLVFGTVTPEDLGLARIPGHFQLPWDASTTPTLTTPPRPTTPPVVKSAWDKPKAWSTLATPSPPVSKNGTGAMMDEDRGGMKNGMYKSMKDALKAVNLSYTPLHSCPRGMINTGNTCYMNSILQSLSSVAPFHRLLHTLSQTVVHSLKSQTPILDSMIDFIKEFHMDGPEKDKQDGEEINPDGTLSLTSFTPGDVYDALRKSGKFASLKGRQEDAEEFLTALLDGMHEEMANCT